MANPKIKIPDLTSSTTFKATDELLIVQDGVNLKLSASTFLNNINSSADIRLNPTQATINTSFSTSGSNNTLYIDGTNDRVGVGTSTPSAALQVVGDLDVGSSTADGIIGMSSENVVGSLGVPAVTSISRSYSTLDCTADSPSVFTLANGLKVGQMKTYTVIAGLSANITFTGLSPIGFTSITLNSLGASVALQYQSTGWTCLGGNDYTLA